MMLFKNLKPGDEVYVIDTNEVSKQVVEIIESDFIKTSSICAKIDIEDYCIVEGTKTERLIITTEITEEIINIYKEYKKELTESVNACLEKLNKIYTDWD